MYRNPRLFIIGTAFTSVLWLAAPAWAQRGHEERGKGNQGRQVTREQTPPRPEGRAVAPARPESRATAPAPPPVQVQRAQPEQRGAQRGAFQAPAPVQRPAPVTRSAPVPRTTQAPRYDRGSQGSRYSVPPPATYRAAPYYSNQYRYGHGYGYTYGYPVRRPVFVQPYYVYRPRFTFSFGIGFGYGVAYPWSYWDPYASYNYGISVRPGYSVSSYYNYVGGVSFDLDPWDASIYVDGHYVGIAGDFGPDQMPLTLAAGRHRIELRRDGFRTARFDVTVAAGQVIPYQGTLQYD